MLQALKSDNKIETIFEKGFFIKEGDFLANKWAPREKGANSELAKIYANLIYPSRIDSYKLYRHLITGNSSHKAGCFIIESYTREYEQYSKN